MQGEDAGQVSATELTFEGCCRSLIMPALRGGVYLPTMIRAMMVD